jgi:hypothetical protein
LSSRNRRNSGSAPFCVRVTLKEIILSSDILPKNNHKGSMLCSLFFGEFRRFLVNVMLTFCGEFRRFFVRKKWASFANFFVRKMVDFLTLRPMLRLFFSANVGGFRLSPNCQFFIQYLSSKVIPKS